MVCSLMPSTVLHLPDFWFWFVFEGDAVVNVYINHEKKFAFVEMRSVEEASNAMALDGIMFEVCGFYYFLIFNFLLLLLFLYICLSDFKWHA